MKETEIKMGIGGTGGVYFLVSPGEFVVEVEKRDLHVHDLRTELRALLVERGCDILAASASNCLSVGNAAALARIREDGDAWDMYLRWEVDYCREAGAVDAGTHIIAVVQHGGRRAE